MKRNIVGAVALACLGLAAAERAQGQPGPMASGAAASMPGTGMGGGMGPGMHRGGGRVGAPYTPGWSLMTDAERTEHRSHMQSFTHKADCEAYMTEHRAKMAERMKEKGQTMHAPRRDPCAGLKP